MYFCSPKGRRSNENRKRIIRYSVLGTLIALVWLTQMLPALGEGYARTAYPVISYILSGFRTLSPLHWVTYL